MKKPPRGGGVPRGGWSFSRRRAGVGSTSGGRFRDSWGAELRISVLYVFSMSCPHYGGQPVSLTHFRGLAAGTRQALDQWPLNRRPRALISRAGGRNPHPLERPWEPVSA